MRLKLENSKKIIETDELIPLGEGKDGTAYKLDDETIIKSIISGYMTEEKIKDLRAAIPNDESIRIVPPIEIATNLDIKKTRVKLNIADGYTSRLIKENPNFILMKSTDSFLEEMHLIRKQVKEYLSDNEIALSDSNPNNLLVSLDNGGIYIIDHDRNITPSSMHYEKSSIRDRNYHIHNDKKFSLLFYKGLLLQLLKYNGIKFEYGGDPVISYVENETERTNITLKTIEETLEGYKTIGEYTRETIRKIKRRWLIHLLFTF